MKGITVQLIKHVPSGLNRKKKTKKIVNMTKNHQKLYTS